MSAKNAKVHFNPRSRHRHHIVAPLCAARIDAVALRSTPAPELVTCKRCLAKMSKTKPPGSIEQAAIAAAPVLAAWLISPGREPCPDTNEAMRTIVRAVEAASGIVGCRHCDNKGKSDGDKPPPGWAAVLWSSGGDGPAGQPKHSERFICQVCSL